MPTIDHGRPAPELRACINLTQLVMRLGTVDRATMHPDGRPESDTTHTCMLALLGTALVPFAAVPLDAGLVAQFALVHDLLEAHAGDTNTARPLSPADRALKEAREESALALIDSEIGLSDGLPWIPELIRRYEAQAEPEARWVHMLDKIVVRLTHAGNECRAVVAMGMSLPELRERNRAQGERLIEQTPGFSCLHGLWHAACAAAEDSYRSSVCAHGMDLLTESCPDCAAVTA